MNAIDPSNNYGGGKVKFLQGGVASPPVVEQVVPLIFGSNYNYEIGFVGFVELPLNVCVEVTQGSQNKSFIVEDVINSFKNWFVKSNLQFNDNEDELDVDIVVQLVIDGITQDTQTLTLTNPYYGEVVFDFELSSPILITESMYYRIDVYETGTLTPSSATIKIPSTTTLLYSSVFGGGRYNGFLNSHFAQGNVVVDDITYALVGNFGGSAYLNTNPAIQNVCPINGFGCVGVYFSLSAITSGSNPSNSITFKVYVDGLEASTINSSAISELLPNTFYYFEFSSPFSINQASQFFLEISRQSADGSSLTFEEVGLIYKVNI
jgi:hypothetical protein